VLRLSSLPLSICFFFRLGFDSVISFFLFFILLI
jgi:hypothetical protein